MTAQRQAPDPKRELGEDITRDTNVAARVVSEVAEREGIDPMELDEQLYEAVDPDALAALVDCPPESTVTISFNYAGYRITVTSDDEEPVVDVVSLA